MPDLGLNLSRLDAKYGWSDWPDEIETVELQFAGEACNPAGLNSTLVSGQFVLVTSELCGPPMNESGDGGVQAVTAAVKAQAAGVVVVTGRASTWSVIGAQPDVAGSGVPIIVSSLSWIDGTALIAAMSSLPGTRVNVTFSYQRSALGAGGYYVGIDHRGLLQELGWQKPPTLQLVTWGAQFLEWHAKLDARLASRAALVVPILSDLPMLGGGGSSAATATVTLPGVALLSQFSKVEVDFALGCFGVLDQDCSAWDRTVSVTVQCSPGTAPAWELTRYITSFRRRVGRWLTDVTTSAGLLTPGATCTFSVSVDMDVWVAQSLSLRFTTSEPQSQVPGEDDEKDGGAGGGGGGPAALRNAAPVSAYSFMPLAFPDSPITFDGPEYNANRTITFQVPPKTVQVLVTALISGHGGCEFLPTSHAFVFNSAPLDGPFNTSAVAYDRFMLAGLEEGCVPKVGVGSCPNQHGTWLYGRNGWCDCLDVVPVVWDVTNAVSLDPSVQQTVRYFALSYDVGGGNPSQAGCGGLIRLASGLAFIAGP